jgi:adenine-specific DNA-methyltransferase
LQLIIDKIKADFRTEIAKNDPLIIKLNKASGELYNLLQNKLFDDDAKLKKANKIKQEKLEADINKWTKEVDEIKNNAIYKNAFEWRFEFPEVLNNNGDFEGFDLLIANPPYIQHRELAHISSYLKTNYSTYSGTADISTYFFEKIIEVLKSKGIFSVINSNKFFNAEYGKKLRSFLSNFNVKSIINFEQVPIFEEALVSSAIFVVEKQIPASTFDYLKFFKEKVVSLDTYLNNEVKFSIISQETLKSENWLFNDLSTDSILDKIKSKGVPISNDTSLDIKRGITTGLDEAFLINDTVKELLLKLEPNIIKVVKPLLKGKDINKYFIKQNALNLLFIPWHYPNEEDKTITGSSLIAEKNFKSQLPTLYSHLEKYKSQLSKRNKDETGIRYEWYALQRCANTYYDDFYKEKIVWGLISGNWGFAYDNNGHFLTSASFFLTSNNISLKFILGLFNSELFRYYFIRVGEYTAGGAYVLKKTSVEKFVIPNVSIAEQDSLIILVDKILNAKKINQNTTDLEQQIDRFVYQLYNLTPDEIAIVENSGNGKQVENQLVEIAE